MLAALLATEAAETMVIDEEPLLKIGLISDLHLNLNYNQHYGPQIDREGDCWTTSG